MELTRETARLFYEEQEPYFNLPDSLEQMFAFAQVPPMGAMLDVACGAGHWLRYVIERRWAVITVGLDFSAKAIERARVNAPEAFLVQADVTEMPFHNDSFDMITCWGSLEHFYDPLGALKEMARLARRLIALVPLDPSSEADQPLFFIGDPSEWEALFARAGWTVSRMAPMKVWRGNIIFMEGQR